ncbi:MAG: hypothetical protein HQ477_13265 [Chloroflexi bacterium]|nr:hypothetical protein [Chloroflexota bacterium]
MIESVHSLPIRSSAERADDLTTPPTAPDPNKPHAGRDEKLRNSKTDTYSSVGRGIGEAPNSRMKKISTLLVVFLIILFIIMEFVDRANAQ